MKIIIRRENEEGQYDDHVDNELVLVNQSESEAMVIAKRFADGRGYIIEIFLAEDAYPYALLECHKMPKEKFFEIYPGMRIS